MSNSLRYPICVGSGLVALDVIYANDTKPQFLAGGSCGNVLTILSFLNWQSYPIARLGDDPEGKRIMEDMKKWGVKTKFIEYESGIHSPRIIEKVFSGKNPKHHFYFKCKHGNWLPQRRPYLLKTVQTIQSKLPVPHVFYFDRATPSALELARNFKKQNTIIFFEPPKFLDDDNFIKCLQISDIVKHCYDQSDDTQKTDIKIPLEIQTKGANGLQYRARFLKQRTWKQINAFPVENLIDAAGSGDWLSAGLIHILLQNNKSKFTPTHKKLEFALRFGQALASINCHFVGARGIMYNLSKSKLLSLTDSILKKNNMATISLNLSSKNYKITPLAKKCKVCLCSK